MTILTIIGKLVGAKHWQFESRISLDFDPPMLRPYPAIKGMAFIWTGEIEIELGVY